MANQVTSPKRPGSVRPQFPGALHRFSPRHEVEPRSAPATASCCGIPADTWRFIEVHQGKEGLPHSPSGIHLPDEGEGPHDQRRRHAEGQRQLPLNLAERHHRRPLRPDRQMAEECLSRGTKKSDLRGKNRRDSYPWARARAQPRRRRREWCAAPAHS